MTLTLDRLAAIAGRPGGANLRSVLAGLARYGEEAGLHHPARLAHFLAQIMHESMGGVYDQEVWGPTPAQRRYEDRADLGHSSAVDGEAYRFRGRAGIQITGRYNYQRFTGWCDARFIDAPDFEGTPDAVNTDPWEGMVPIWYWDAGNPDSQSLNRYADQNDIEMVTRRINGGLNGFDDRLRYYTRAALVLLGRQPDDIRGFQSARGLTVDGISGPRTRAELHAALLAKAPKAVPSLDAPLVGAATVAAASLANQDAFILAGLVAVALAGAFLWRKGVFNDR